MRRGLAFVMAAGAALLALAPAASADHHEVKITEVFPGVSDNPMAEFVEIQMFLSGQELLSQADLVFYDGTSSITGTLPLANVLSGANQRTLLAGTSQMETTFPVQADVEYGSAAISPAGGGLCLVSDSFGTLDCVAWGTATVALAGTSEAAIPDGSSIVRDISAGCNTLLERSDDTGSSLDDFAPSGLPTPQPNSEAGFNSTCPNTRITKKPKAKTKDRTPKFEFSGGDGFLCSLDRSKAEACDSGVFKPGRLSRGKHEFVVQATESDGSRDGTPAKYTWKIVKKK